MRAVQSNAKGAALEVVSSRPKPVVEGEDDVIIKIEYSACNPVDNFMIATGVFVQAYPNVFGCDCSGVVEEAGSNATVKPGDRVAAYPGLGRPTTGTFAEFVKVDRRLVFNIPDSMKLEEACTLGVGSLTAAMLFYGVFEKELEAGASKQPVLVYGASSAVGMFAVQLAKLEGHTVVAIASQKNFELLKSLGADQCFDYKSDNWKQEAIEALKKVGSPLAIDTISTDATLGACAEILQASGGKVVASTLAHDNVGSITVAPVDLGVIPGPPGETEKVYSYVPKINAFLQQGKLNGTPTKLVAGGLSSVAQALKDLSDGKASGCKFVIRVQD